MQGLINVIPDESALIQRLFIGVLGVFVHGAVGIAHGVGIFAQDEGLIPMLLQERPNARHRGIHLALHVGCIVVTAIMEDAFIMHQPGIIQLPEPLTHSEGHLAANGFVANAPDQDAGMVLIPMIGRINPIQHGSKPILTVARQCEVQLLPRIDEDFIPHAMAFQIVLRNQINAQLIAELIQSAVIRVVAGSQGIDVIALHGQQIPANHLRLDGTAGLGAEVVTIHALENDALPVQAHDAVLHFKAAEAYRLPGYFAYLALSVLKRDVQAVQLRVLRTPLFRGLNVHHCFRQVIFPVHVCLGYHLRPIKQGKVHRVGTGSVNVRRNGQSAVRIAVIQLSTDGNVLQMLLRQCVQIHIPEQAAEAEEILILCPAAGTPMIHTAGQLISAGNQIRGQVKLAGGKAIPCKAHILAIEPHSNAAFRPLKGHVNRHALHGLRQSKRLHIAGYRIVVLRDLPRFNFLTAVPRVLNVHILRNTMSFQLNMCRNGNVFPIAAVILRLLKVRDHLLFRAGTEKLPIAI